MQKDFHYYATYCAAFLAGFTHEECMQICYSAQFTDYCSKSYLAKIKAPESAATTQLNMEMANMRTDTLGIQDITRIWSSFHFLPYDLYANNIKASKRYLDKYRLICKPNGKLVKDTVELAKNKTYQACGIAMHVLADTWAHMNFVGTPSLVINSTNHYFYELFLNEDGTYDEKQITFRHSLGGSDDLENSRYANSIFQMKELSIMNLGHGRAGHLPDYSFIRYKYLPAWNNYEYFIKDNPSDYMNAFMQMIYALKFLKGTESSFELERYDEEAIKEYREEIKSILEKRQLDACDDWKKFGEKLSGCEIEDFDLLKYQEEYMNATAESKDETFLGKYILAALAQKSMVTNRIYKSGNRLAGISVDYNEKGFKGIKDYFKLVSDSRKAEKDNDELSEN